MADETNPNAGGAGETPTPDGGSTPETGKGKKKLHMPQSKALSGAARRAGGAAARGAGKLAGNGTKGLNDSFDSNNPSEDIAGDQAQNLTNQMGDAAGEAGHAAKDTFNTVKDVGSDIKSGLNRRKEKKEEQKKKDEEQKKKDSKDDKPDSGNKDGSKGGDKDGSKGDSKGGGDSGKKGTEGSKKGADSAKGARKGGGDTAKGASNAAGNSKKAGEKTAQMAEKARAAAQKAAEKAAKAAKAAKDAIKEAAKAIADAVINLVKILIQLIAEFWWVFLIIFIIIFIVWGICVLCANYADNESTTGNVLTDTESLSEENNLEVDENDIPVQVDISSGSKIITAYYTYYSTKSIWILFDGMVYNCRTDVEAKDYSIDLSKMPKQTVTIDGKSYQIVRPVQYGSSEFINIYQYDPFTGSGLGIDGRTVLRDKYERESSFYLSTEALISLDKTLHHGQFRYPEQLVQKVKYKVVIDDAAKGKYHYELDDLADENGVLFKEDVTDDSGKIVNYATLSTAYTQDLDKTAIDGVVPADAIKDGLWLPVTNASGKVTEKVTGVWDYGFGSILHYLKYLEAHENRGEVVSFEVLHKGVWDTSNDNKATTKMPYTMKWVPGSTFGVNIDKYTNEKQYTVTLYKNAVVETLTYDEWNALTAEQQAEYFTGRGQYGDPTHQSFNKNRVYGLPSTTSYMIDWVVTPAGTMTTQVAATWKDSGIPFAVVENDGGVDYSDTEFNGVDGFDNGKNDVYAYNDEKIVVQKITSNHKATAEFSWGEQWVDMTTGKLKAPGPFTNIYYLRYVLTGDTTVDTPFTSQSLTTLEVDGVTQYALKSSAIHMFDSSTGLCNNCGKAPTKIKYEAVSHNSCKSKAYNVTVDIIGLGVGTKTYSYKNQWNNTAIKVDANGKVTSTPSAKKISHYQRTTNPDGTIEDVPVYSSSRLNLINTNTGKCRVCGKTAVKQSNQLEDHSDCTTVTYNYDLIDTEEVAIGDIWGLADGYIQLIRNVEGTKWDKEPEYTGEPDTSKILGKKYYEDYFNNYATWVPTSVQSDFNFELMKNQTGLDEAGLLGLLERESVSESVAVIGGMEDYFVDGVYNIDSDGKIHGYIGPGVSVITFEQGCPGSKNADRVILEKGVTAKPNAVNTLSLEGFPNYGVCQMNRTTLAGFKTWMLENEDRADMWYKIFGNIAVDTSGEGTAFSVAWRNSVNVLSDEEYVTFMVYQLAYSYYWSMAQRQSTWAGYLPSYEDNRAVVELFWMMANNGSLNTALKHAGLGSNDPDAIIDAVCTSASTYGRWGNYTSVMRRKFDTNIRRFYHTLSEYNLPVFKWDTETKMFSEVGGTTTGGWSITRFWNELIGKKTDDAGNTYYPWEKLFKDSQVKIVKYTTSDGQVVYGSTDANESIPRNYFKINSVAATDIEHEIAKIFASADKVPVSTYRPLTDNFFIMRYQELFANDLSKGWGVSKKGISNYLPDGWTGIFSKNSKSTDPNDTDFADVRYTITREFNQELSPTIKILLAYGGSDVDGESVEKKPIAIHSASKGTILEFGSNAEFGGAYVAVQYRKSVIYYGNITPITGLQAGDIVEAKTLLGFVQSGDFLYLTMKTSVNGLYIDPSPLLKGGLEELVEEARKYLGFDYEWGGQGPVSCFSPRCCKESDHLSYVDGAKWAFDCAGLVTYCCKSLGMKKDEGKDPWVALGANAYSQIGEDVTMDYWVDGAIDWESVPAGILVFFNWNGNGGIDHVGIWSGEGSLVHASGSNPYQMVNGVYATDSSGRMLVPKPEANHAKNDKMVKEYFLGAVPAGAYISPYASTLPAGIESPLRANAFNDYYKKWAVKLVDVSMYLTGD